MAYNFDRIPNRRRQCCEMDIFPPDVLPMWVADMDFRAPPPILKAFQRFMKQGDMGYQLPFKELYEGIAGG
jgi:cystathionine beta-lyase